MQTFELKYEKSRAIEFIVYYNGNRLKNKESYQFQANTSLLLVERNLLLQRLWWLLLIGNFILACFGSPIDLKEIRTKQKKIVLTFADIVSSKLSLTIQDGRNYELLGVTDLVIASEVEVDLPLVIKRIKNYKKVLIIAIFSILAIVLLILLGGYLSTK